MPLDVAEGYLDLGLGRARKLAIGLVLGGVLSEVEDRLAVRPAILRAALVRKTFFEGPVPLDYRPLLELAPSFESSVSAIVTAMGYGAEVPALEIQDLVRQCPAHEPWQLYSGKTPQVWLLYTSLGEEEARWALENYPGDALDIARNALKQARRAAIPRLFERVAGDEAMSGQSLDLLREWMQDLSAEEARPGELIDRRKLVVRLAQRYLTGGGERHVAIRVLFQALSPRLTSTCRDPGVGRTLTTRQGLLPPVQLSHLEEIWQTGRDVIEELDSTTWNLLKSASWDWTYPESAAPGAIIEPAARESIRNLAHGMLTDLATLAHGSPGLAAGLRRLARRVDCQLELPTDPIFDLIYPADNSRVALRERMASETAALEELAGCWAADRPPEGVARLLVGYEDEAHRIAQRWPRRTPELCRLLATKVDSPERWAVTFFDQGLAPDLLRPFLEVTVTDRRPGWMELLERCLELEPYTWEAVGIVLTLQEPPPALLDQALARSATFPHLLETLCLRQEVPQSTLRSLLEYPVLETALATAVGEWNADPQGRVTEGVKDPWRHAILRSAQVGTKRALAETSALGYWLGEILSDQRMLASQWLEKILGRGPELVSAVRELVFLAIRPLQEKDRLAVLERLESDPVAYLILPQLVDRNTTLYDRLLALERLKDLHLRPLVGLPDAQWIEMARMALIKDHEPRAIARASIRGADHIWSGYGRDYWSGWDRAFVEILGDPDHGLREVADYGREIVQVEFSRAAARMREHELDGL